MNKFYSNKLNADIGFEEIISKHLKDVFEKLRIRIQIDWLIQESLSKITLILKEKSYLADLKDTFEYVNNMIIIRPNRFSSVIHPAIIFLRAQGAFVGIAYALQQILTKYITYTSYSGYYINQSPGQRECLIYMKFFQNTQSLLFKQIVGLMTNT